MAYQTRLKSHVYILRACLFVVAILFFMLGILTITGVFLEETFEFTALLFGILLIVLSCLLIYVTGAKIQKAILTENELIIFRRFGLKKIIYTYSSLAGYNYLHVIMPGTRKKGIGVITATNKELAFTEVDFNDLESFERELSRHIHLDKNLRVNNQI